MSNTPLDVYNLQYKQIIDLREKLTHLCAQLDACESYLKDGETPAARIQREIDDNAALLGLMALDKKRIAELETELAEARKEAARLKARSIAYEDAYRVAYLATYQSHNGHWDATMQGGRGCPECIRAREARENCDAILREGLEHLVTIAGSAK